MTYETPKVKRPRYFPKDWDRRARVQAAMNQSRKTQKDLCDSLGINDGYISSIIWGTQRSTKWEQLIAIELGQSWQSLFGTTAEVRSVA